MSSCITLLAHCNLQSILCTYTLTPRIPAAGDSLASAQLLRKRLSASHVNEAMRWSMLSTLFATFAAFLQVVQHGHLKFPYCILKTAQMQRR